jgi:predicted porin
MQKKLLALAIASLASTGAFAQSSVTIYGVVDLAVESGKYSDAAGNLTRMIPGGNTTNRLGFRGTEDLGNGMAANFILETQPGPDNGAGPAGGQFWNRITTVGLSSKSWGSVNMGRFYTPWFLAHSAYDTFYTAGVGSNYSLQAGDTRMNNAIWYNSVPINGFTVMAMWGLGQDADATGAEGTTATTKKLGREVGIKLSYANGPIAINYGYDNQTTAVAVDVNTKRNQLNGSYDFKVVKLGFNWNTNKNDAGTLDDRVWGFYAAMPVMGKDTIKFGYTRLTDKVTVNKDARLLAIGYEHPMSKRTNLYATYAKMTNDSAASKSMLGAVGVAAGYDPSAFQFGLRHTF